MINHKLSLSLLMLVLSIIACNTPTRADSPTVTASIPLPSATSAAATATDAQVTDTPAAVSEATDEPCTADALLVTELAPEPDAPVRPGQTFMKTWRVHNSGTCTWDSTYVIKQTNRGYLIAEPNETPLPSVAPGADADVSAIMTLSDQAPIGSEQDARFQLHAPSGGYFGPELHALILVSTQSNVPPVSATSTSAPAGSIDACALYTQAEVAALFGEAATLYISGTRPDPSGQTADYCTYSTTTGYFISLTVINFGTSDTAAQAYQDAKAQFGLSQSITGLGDEAGYQPDVPLVGSVLFARQGGFLVSVSLVAGGNAEGTPAPPMDSAVAKERAQTIMQTMLPRLP